VQAKRRSIEPWAAHNRVILSKFLSDYSFASCLRPLSRRRFSAGHGIRGQIKPKPRRSRFVWLLSPSKSRRISYHVVKTRQPYDETVLSKPERVITNADSTRCSLFHGKWVTHCRGACITSWFLKRGLLVSRIRTTSLRSERGASPEMLYQRL
jgi:hypothetical protein